MIDLSLHQYPYRMEAPAECSDSSSPSSSSSTTPPLPASEPASTDFAFLVHSQDTLPHNLPPSVDNKPLARQRRRRTSPEDQAILEAEFLRDSKPDKEARQRIVERVALGEKEVQIWFQNRRQTSRRKSRPLLPHEIFPYLNPSSSPAAADMQIVSTLVDSEADCGIVDTTSINASSGEPAEDENDVELQQGETNIQHGKVTPDARIEQRLEKRGHAWQAGGESKGSQDNNAPSSNTSKDGNERRPETTFDEGTKALHEDGTSIVEDRDEHERVESPAEVIREREESVTKTSKKQPSQIRLSLTSAGNARILTGDESSPSPPKSQPYLMTSTGQNTRGLRRSHSVAGLNEKYDAIAPINFEPRAQRIPSGRSRDSRAWEFWCDSDSRNELAKKAEQEQTGSAADAISLIRSNSRSVLNANLLRENHSRGNIVVVEKHGYPSKRVKNVHPKQLPHVRRLARVQSSLARLQSAREIRAKPHDDVDQQQSKGGLDSGAQNTSCSPNSDSDKENQLPGGFQEVVMQEIYRRPHKKSYTSRAALGESRTAPSQSNRQGQLSGMRTFALRKSASSSSHPVDSNPERDEEIAAFMGEGRSGCKDYTPSFVPGDEDMDCIQGLLSLSRGDWR